MSDEQKPPEKPSLEKVIKSWLVAHGEETFARGDILPYYKIDPTDYPYTLNALLQSLIAAGFDETENNSELTIRRIQEALTPAVHDSAKLKKWRDVIRAIWTHYLTKEYADISLIKPAKEYTKSVPKKKEVIPAEDGAELSPMPVSKLDPDKFEGFGEAQIVDDEEFLAQLEAMKNE